VRHWLAFRNGWRQSLLAWLLWVCAACPVGAATVTVLQVRDAIGPASADYIIRGIGKAEQARAAMVVIELDTPGGLDTSMRDVIRTIMASRVPVAIYVSPEGARAASAGTYILYAAHVAAMAPATTLGAATPVAIGMPGTPRPGDDKQRPAEEKPRGSASAPQGDAEGRKTPAPPGGGDAMSAKQVHDAAALIRGLAQQRGRNAEWAERAVREAVSLTAQEALREKVIDILARDRADLLAQADGRTVRLADREVKLATRGAELQVILPDWRQRLLSVIANPSLALILLMVGIYGLMFEFAAPGHAVSGTVGAICLLLALFAFQLLPVNYAGLGLVLLGVALLVAEVFTSSFGVLGVGGVVAFVAGALLLFDRDVPGFGVPLPLIFGLAVLSVLVMVASGGMALRVRKRSVVSGVEAMVGARGIVLLVEPGGAWAQVHGERWQVHGPPDLAPGDRIRVLAVHGLRLEVERWSATQQQDKEPSHVS
jgi:membrane-bound serine protease (ClpP class)